MKIMQIVPNYYVPKKNMQNRNISQNHASSPISFGSQNYILEENKHIDNVKTSLYYGGKNSSADNVTAAQVVLEDGAQIKNLQLKESRFFTAKTLPIFNKKNIFVSDITLFNNSKIDVISNETDKQEISITCVAETEVPQILNIQTDKPKINKCFFFKDNFHAENVEKYAYLELRDNATIKNVITSHVFLNGNSRAEYIEAQGQTNLGDNAQADTIKCRHDVYLSKKSKAKNIESNYVSMADESTAKNITARSVKIEHNAHAEKINCNVLCCNGFEDSSNYYHADYLKTGRAVLENYSRIKQLEADSVTMKENAEIENLTIKNRLSMEMNAKINNLNVIGSNTEFIIKDNAQIKNMKAGQISLNGDVFIDNLVSENAELAGNVKAENIKVKNFLSLSDNTEVNNITITGDHPEIQVNGNVKIKGKIIFENAKGKVIVKRGQDGTLSQVRASQAVNGEMDGDYIPFGFEKVAGMKELKKTFYEDIINPMLMSDDYAQYGLDTVVNGFLLYGPPGCGKTFITKMLAEETGRYFVEFSSSDIGSIYQHQTVINIASKFDEAIKNAPSIIFIDEVESMAPSRETIADWDVETNERVTELLQQINNCKDKDVFVVFASNEPQKIDNAIKRTGRIDKKIFLGPPDAATRQELFERNLKKIAKKDENIDTAKLADLTENYTAEDIRMVVRQAAVFAMRERKNISLGDLEQAVKETKPSLTDSMVELYKKKGLKE